jgi:hypothetical protein
MDHSLGVSGESGRIIAQGKLPRVVLRQFAVDIIVTRLRRAGISNMKQIRMKSSDICGLRAERARRSH